LQPENYKRESVSKRNETTQEGQLVLKTPSSHAHSEGSDHMKETLFVENRLATAGFVLSQIQKLKRETVARSSACVIVSSDKQCLASLPR
jgi:hypothetical protein